ncbi:GGDEF domain-containing protein [Dyella japonica]|uniref:diguanylate cyclase n=1 Tax=Dyella japonica A8 TaxID=1217721 RepID=A0A075JZU3_9GAMM|nr:GGDEF domain-containing protein [Dyella japonica]AIF47581.1 signal transduction protein [Dyella japonica A8]
MQLGNTVEWIARLAHAGTLLIVNALLAGLSSAMFLALYATRRNLRRVRGVLAWGLSYAAFAVGFGILVLPAFHIDFAFLALLGNLVIDIGAVLGLLAVNAYLELSRRRLWVLLPVAVLAFVEIGAVIAGGENFRLMVVLGNSLTALLVLATGAALWQCQDAPRRPVARMAAAFHFLWALMLLIRMAWWLVHPGANVGQESTSTFGLLSRLILTWVITPSFLWMLTRQLDAELIRQARHDPLTGVPNRRVIWEQGERIAAEADRRDTTMAVLMIDVDHFKAINDRWGHDGGDQVLIAIAATLDRHVRSDDLLARVGGEEFMVLIPHGDGPAVREIAERLRVAVESRPIAMPSGERLTCTVSIGCCLSPRGQARWRDVVIAADQALYAAKRHGRNRVELAAPPASDADPSASAARPC